MSAQQGTMVGGRSSRVPTSLIVIALVGVFVFSVTALLTRESTTERAPALNSADFAGNGAAARERHEALGRLGALDPADFAGNGAAARERHEALGRLGALDPADFAGNGASARERHDALGRLGANER